MMVGKGLRRNVALDGHGEFGGEIPFYYHEARNKLDSIVQQERDEEWTDEHHSPCQQESRHIRQHTLWK